MLRVLNKIMLIGIVLGSVLCTSGFSEGKNFIVIVPSYNNEEWAERSLRGILDQSYPNFRVVYVDDASEDRTVEVVKKVIAEHPRGNKVHLIQNSERKRQLYNTYHAIKSFANSDDVVVVVDGDDRLASNGELSWLNMVYQNPKVWMTTSRLRMESTGQVLPVNFSRTRKIPVSSNKVGEVEFPLTTHLRSFYSWLFNLIREKDLKRHGEFYSCAADFAYLYPMFTMAGKRYHCIKRPMYIYNDLNSLNLFRTRSKEQEENADYILLHSRYKQLAKRPIFRERGN